MAEQLNELKDYIVTVCKEKMNHEVPGTINTELPIQEAFQLDSISLFELIVNIEEKYETKIPDSDIEQLGKMKLDELLHYLEGKTSVA